MLFFRIEISIFICALKVQLRDLEGKLTSFKCNDNRYDYLQHPQMLPTFKDNKHTHIRHQIHAFIYIYICRHHCLIKYVCGIR